MEYSIFAFIPHLLFWGAQASCGIMLIAFSGPPIVILVRSFRLDYCMTTRELLNSYPVVWQTIFGSSWTEVSLIQVVVLMLIGLVVGMIFSEFFYRLAERLKYHSHLRLESPNKPDEIKSDEIKHFKTRCLMLKHLHLHRMYEWENLQYTFTYYVEANLWMVFFVLLTSGSFTLCSSSDMKDKVVLSVLLLVIVV